MVRTSVRNMTLRVFRLDDEAMQRFVLRVARPDEAVVNLDFVRRIYGDLQWFMEIYSDLWGLIVIYGDLWRFMVIIYRDF